MCARGVPVPTPSLSLKTDVPREEKGPNTRPAAPRSWGGDQDVCFGHDGPEMLVRSTWRC